MERWGKGEAFGCWTICWSWSWSWLWRGPSAPPSPRGCRRPVRLALAGILLLLFLGVVGLVLWAGIGSGNGKLVLLGIVLAAGFAAWLVSRIRRLEKGRRRK